MISKDFTINNKLGLHARPSAQLTQIAGRYESEVFIARNGRRVNAKSIMGGDDAGCRAWFNRDRRCGRPR
jgi:phosphocarrier protein